MIFPLAIFYQVLTVQSQLIGTFCKASIKKYLGSYNLVYDIETLLCTLPIFTHVHLCKIAKKLGPRSDLTWHKYIICRIYNTKLILFMFYIYILVIWSPGSKICNRRVKTAVWFWFRLLIYSNEKCITVYAHLAPAEAVFNSRIKVKVWIMQEMPHTKHKATQTTSWQKYS